MKTFVNYIKESKNSKKSLLWIDDIRNPKEEKWMDFIHKTFGKNNTYNITWVKSYKEFVEYINKKGIPQIISFDNDLGDVDYEDKDHIEKTGYDCGKYLVDYFLDNNLCVDDFPVIGIQSDNGPGRENISKLLNNFYNYLKKTNK